jgi:hypothetical protein
LSWGPPPEAEVEVGLAYLCDAARIAWGRSPARNCLVLHPSPCVLAHPPPPEQDVRDLVGPPADEVWRCALIRIPVRMHEQRRKVTAAESALAARGRPVTAVYVAARRDMTD